MIEIRRYTPADSEAVLRIAQEAWEPVFRKTRREVPRFVYENFYPDGWWSRQCVEIEELLSNEPDSVWIATWQSEPVGFVSVRIHPEDRMAEIHIIAVRPLYQRRGCGSEMMRFAQRHAREQGMEMLMVETVGDSGHAPARAAYEEFGFRPWPVARYFKDIVR